MTGKWRVINSRAIMDVSRDKTNQVVSFFTNFDSDATPVKTYHSTDGWLLLMNQVSSTYYTVLSNTAELTSLSVAGASTHAQWLIKNAKEIRYTDASGVVFLEAHIDGEKYWNAMHSSTTVPVPVTYKGGPMAGVQRYIEVQTAFHWGHRNNVPTNGGKTTGIQDIHNDGSTHWCWEHVTSGVQDRPFAWHGAHGLCPATETTYTYDASTFKRGGSANYRKWVRGDW